MRSGKIAVTKNITTIVFSFLILLACHCMADAAEYASVAKDGVNIRSGPDTKEEVLWEVFHNFPLKILKRQGEWAQAEDFEGDKGWIHSSLLSKNKTVIVKVKNGNMRIGPGLNYEIVATVKYGVVFLLEKTEGEWLKVKHGDGTTGWVHRNLAWPSDI